METRQEYRLRRLDELDYDHANARQQSAIDLQVKYEWGMIDMVNGMLTV